MGPATTGKERVSESFVARIWLERGSNGDPVWRGHIRHIQGKEETYFQDLGTLNDFLARVSGVTGPTSTAQPLKDAAKTEPGTGTVTNMKRKD